MKIIRALISIFLLFSVVFTFTVGVKKISSEKFNQTTDYKGIITLWQIDAFEGGIGSRKQFLLREAKAFENENPGVLVMALDMSISSAEEKIKEGLFPDLISFGVGVDVKNFSSFKIDRESKGGKVGNSKYAVSWCRGNYVLIANPKLTESIPTIVPTLLISQINYTNPLTALALEGIEVKDYTVKSPMDAYVEFVIGKTPYFLGTQRDVIRLNNRGFNYIAKPLENFNDLYQYVCITASTIEKSILAKRFIEYLISDTVQNELFKIGMFSEYLTVEYQDETMQKMSEIKKSKTLSAFISKESLINLNDISKSAIRGENESLNKLKNMLY